MAKMNKGERWVLWALNTGGKWRILAGEENDDPSLIDSGLTDKQVDTKLNALKETIRKVTGNTPKVKRDK